jgi:hypothetical protein
VKKYYVFGMALDSQACLAYRVLLGNSSSYCSAVVGFLRRLQPAVSVGVKEIAAFGNYSGHRTNGKLIYVGKHQYKQVGLRGLH